ncbi:hypothetical protein O181_075356 [Austropuccinia psidii MF-1]|uniref:Reverse transcriptase/retrotransposon-derived protein RNase H-like domain-containing protein n=1 Tax=Austropuccinia psidii MF-1 TaxID=1389203 RepID=A0A9Q3FEH6_9BASI|nr:hypothetical protein [Austropuccinia psidii MF-1]
MWQVVPPAYHQYLDVFSKVKAEKLPPHPACDHHIGFEGLLPPIGVIYSLPNQESETLWAYISENVEEGFMRASSSSTGAPVFFVKKKDGGLCLCVEYPKLNAVTRKNRYPVPPMNQLLTVFNSSTIFSKIDLHGAYSLLRIKEGYEHLTAFRTKYGSYEYLVMPFGLTNAPASFQNLVNDFFADFLDMPKDGLFKSSANPQLASAQKHQGSSILGFANLYHCFIKNYSKKSLLSLPFSKEDSPFIFNEEALSQFQILKESFTTAPILAHLNPSLPAIVKTDASEYALGAVLSEVNDSGRHPIEFDSCKLLPAELNYEIHAKELLGIVWALKRWRAFVLSLSNTFEVLTDHYYLHYFMSSKVLTCRQARWAEFFSEIHFTITYRPGRLATLQDALSHWEEVYPERGWTSSARILKIFIK